MAAIEAPLASGPGIASTTVGTSEIAPVSAPPSFSTDTLSPQSSFQEFLSQTRPLDLVADRPSSPELPEQPSLINFEKAFMDEPLTALDPEFITSAEATALTIEEASPAQDINPFHNPAREDPHYMEASGAVEEAMIMLQEDLDQKTPLENLPKPEQKLPELDQKLGEELVTSLEEFTKVKELPHIELDYPDFTFKPEPGPDLVKILQPQEMREILVENLKVETHIKPEETKVVQKALEITTQAKAKELIEPQTEVELEVVEDPRQEKIKKTLEEVAEMNQTLTKVGLTEEQAQEATSQILIERGITQGELEAYVKQQEATLTEKSQEMDNPQEVDQRDSIIIDGVRYYFVADRPVQGSRKKSAEEAVLNSQEDGKLKERISDKVPESESLESGITQKMSVKDGTLNEFRHHLRTIDEMVSQGKIVTVEDALRFINTALEDNTPVTLNTTPSDGVGMDRVEKVLQGAFEMNVVGTPSDILKKKPDSYQTVPKR